MYHLSSADLYHNHPAFFDDHLPKYKPSSDKQKSFICELTPLSSLGRRDVQVLMKVRFPDHPLSLSQISNMLDQTKQETRNHVENLGDDMVSTVALLIRLKGEDERWVVHVEADMETQRFRCVFWMSPT